MIDALLKGPLKQYNSIIASPKKFVDLSNSLLTDPSLDSAWGVATGVLAIVQAIEPLLRLSDDIINNPLKSPYAIAKAMTMMPVQNITSVMELGIEMIRDPLGTGKKLYQSIIHAPKHVGKSVERSIKRVFGKKKKRKKPVQVLPSQAELKRLGLQMGAAVEACYKTGHERWFIMPDKSAEDYFRDLWADWSATPGTKKLPEDFLRFVGMVQSLLSTENFAEIRRLSPRAHAKETIAPLQVVLIFRQLAVETLMLHNATTRLKQVTSQEIKATQTLTASVKTLTEKSDRLAALMDTPEKRAALHAKFASKMTEEARIKLLSKK